MPTFQVSDAGSDFNDMAQLYGNQAVQEAIEGAGEALESSPEVQTLMAYVMPEAYPVDAMPACIRAAVEEMVRYVQAQLPLHWK